MNRAAVVFLHDAVREGEARAPATALGGEARAGDVVAECAGNSAAGVMHGDATSFFEASSVL